MLVEKPSLAPIAATPQPDWVSRLQVEGDEVCGIGIAGRTYQTQWEKAKALATERANANLAGTLQSSVLESEIVKDTERGAQIEYSRTVDVDPETIEGVAKGARTDTWYDVKGEGPASEAGFTYARSCLAASIVASQLKIPPSAIKQVPSGVEAVNTVPPWLGWIGSQRGARLCAVGYSDPGYYSEALVQSVADDVRGQLVTAAKSVVMSAFEETSICKGEGTARCEQEISELTAATNEAVSRGVVVTHFWFDKNGLGPRQRKRSVYGWGCVYPIVAVHAASAPAPAQAATPAPDADAIAKVKARAEAMFEELDQAEFKRRTAGK